MCVGVLGVGVLGWLSTDVAEAKAAETEVLVGCTSDGGHRHGEGGGGGMLC